MHSVHTGQEYRIRVQKPQNFDPAREYTIIYVADGSYGVWQFLMDPKNKISIPDNCVVIAICHTGEKEADRNRDLIPADISNNAKKNYGQANRFYLFIRDELIPFVEKEFPSAKRKVFIGHSLSGLFCLYLIFQGQQLFDHYYAISPSLWANWFELLKIENAYCDHHNDLSANITIYAGSLEVFDLIRISVYKFVNNIQKRRYKSLRLNYNIIPNARHFTIRKPVLEQIMDSLKK
jgi:predicted alpha/beta superfamily hydrolase